MSLKHCLLTDLLDECRRKQDLTIRCRDGKFVCNSFLFASVFPGIGKMLDSPNVEEENLVIFILDICVQDLRVLFDKIYNRHNITIEQNCNIHFLLKWSHVNVNSSMEIFKADLTEIIKWETNDECVFEQYQPLGENSEHNDEDNPVLIPLLKKKVKQKVESNSDDNWEVENYSDEEHNNYIERRVTSEYIGGKKHGSHPPIACPECEEMFYEAKTLDNHRKKVHSEKLICPECGKQFIKERYEAHLQSHVDHQIPCKECDEVFKNPTNLKNHMKYVHNGYVPPKILADLCDRECKCGIAFKQGKDKVSHYQLVHLDYQQCPKCQKSLDQQLHKCEPIKKSQASKKAKRVICQECGKECSSSNLRYHMEKYHETVECSCHKCGKKYGDKMSLRDHLRDCMKSEQCTICGAVVLRLKDHIRSVHTADEDKRFVCNFCGKGFFDQKKLENHKMNVHLKLRPHRCRYGCDIGYNDTSNRNAHEKKKHGGLFSDARRGLPID